MSPKFHGKSYSDYEARATQLQSIKKTTADQRQAAARWLQSQPLPPIEDWDGDLVAGWLDIFGLNDRPVRVTHKNQGDSVAYPSN